MAANSEETTGGIMDSISQALKRWYRWMECKKGCISHENV